MNSRDALRWIHSRCHDDADCWIWGQGMNSAGYPQMRHKGAATLVRRVVVELSGKAPPQGKWVAMSDNGCNRKLCCNPAHLKAGTYSERMQLTCKSGARGTFAEYVKRRDNAIKRGMTKINIDIARAVRASDRPAHEHAEELGMSADAIRRIRRGDHWREAAPNSSIFAHGAAR